VGKKIILYNSAFSPSPSEIVSMMSEPEPPAKTMGIREARKQTGGNELEAQRLYKKDLKRWQRQYAFYALLVKKAKHKKRIELRAEGHAAKRHTDDLAERQIETRDPERVKEYTRQRSDAKKAAAEKTRGSRTYASAPAASKKRSRDGDCAADDDDDDSDWGTRSVRPRAPFKTRTPRPPRGAASDSGSGRGAARPRASRLRTSTGQLASGRASTPLAAATIAPAPAPPAAPTAKRKLPSDIQKFDCKHLGCPSKRMRALGTSFGMPPRTLEACCPIKYDPDFFDGHHHSADPDDRVVGFAIGPEDPKRHGKPKEPSPVHDGDTTAPAVYGLKPYVAFESKRRETAQKHTRPMAKLLTFTGEDADLVESLPQAIHKLRHDPRSHRMLDQALPPEVMRRMAKHAAIEEEKRILVVEAYCGAYEGATEGWKRAYQNQVCGTVAMDWCTVARAAHEKRHDPANPRHIFVNAVLGPKGRVYDPPFDMGERKAVGAGQMAARLRRPVE